MKSTNSKSVYEIDASQIKGNAKEVYVVESVEEIQNLVRVNENISPRGAGTGLAGGSVPDSGVVVDLSKMNKILKFNPEKRTVEVEAGIVLDDLNDFLEEYGLEFPVNPSSHEVCSIGGMIATDAVGSRAIKYGRTSKWVDWIEVVDSTGNAYKRGKTDLADFAGLEGITGIITKASLSLVEKMERTLEILEFSDMRAVIDKVKELKRNQSVSMVEFLDRQVSGFIKLSNNYHLFVEYESSEGSLKGEDYNKAMKLRDSVYPLLAEAGYERIEDPKLFLEKIPELLTWLEEHKIPVFGHISVGILHPCFSKSKEKFIPEMMKLVKHYSGQVSGEHGIGLLKKQFLDDNDKKIIKLIKARLDPGNKFNPGKVI